MCFVITIFTKGIFKIQMKKDKKLIIHIGVRKTATTTLQNGLFVQLHNKGLINYLGKVNLINNDLKNVEEINKNYQKVIDCLLYRNEENCYLHNLIKSDIVNIFSDEILSNIAYNIKKTRKVTIDTSEFAKKIYTYFESAASNIVILVTIRNQQTFIPSNYAQIIKYNMNNPKIKTWKKYLNFLLNNKQIFSNFYYDKLLQSWVEVFGKDQIKILFYEDFLEDKRFFVRELSKIIGISEDTVMFLLEGKHFNKKQKTEKGVIVNAKVENPLKELVRRVYKNPAIYNLFEPIKRQWPNNFLARKYREIPCKYEHIIIEKPTKNEEKIIFEEFRKSNLNLFEKYGLNFQKLKKYGYI